MRKRVLLLVLVAGLGALLAWLDVHDSASLTPDTSARAQEPSHVVENATLTLFGESGRRQQTLTTPLLTHTPARAITQLNAPRATLFDRQQRRWHASAEHGTLDRRELLTLSGDARIYAPEQGWQLETERLHYDSDNAYVYSDTPVRLEQPPQYMQAQRMDAWLNQDALRLSGDVRGYHPVEAAHEETP